MNKVYRNVCYRLAIDGPNVALYCGGKPVESGTVRKDEIEVDTVKRVINKYLKGKCYTEYLKLNGLVGIPKERSEANWLDFLKSAHAVILRALLDGVEEDIGGRF